MQPRTLRTCPCCGGDASDSGIYLDPDFSIVRTVKGVAALGPAQYELLQAFLTCWPRPAWTNWLEEVTDSPPRHAFLRRKVTKLRAKLKPLGLSILRIGRGAEEPGYLLVVPPEIASAGRRSIPAPRRSLGLSS